MNRFIPLIFASILPLSLFPWFAPAPMNQLDFMILWLVAMVLLALPMVYAEIALAYRSGLPPLTGMQKLTREADASMAWRGFSWLSAVIAILLASGLVGVASKAIIPILGGMGVPLPSIAVTVGLMVVAVIASMWGMATAFFGLVLIVVGSAMSLMTGMNAFNLTMTNISLAEWGRAVMMALVSVGAGSGLYWFAVTNEAKISANNKNIKRSASKAVLPIWGVQLLMGTLSLLVLAMTDGLHGSSNSILIVLSFGLVFVAAALLSFASQLFTSKFANPDNTNPLTKHIPTVKGMVLTLVIACALVLIPNSIQQLMVVVLTSLSVLMLSVFAGWQMKISHLRKSMNFGSELTYNLWRVAVRLVVPIGILAGFAGWLMAFIG